MGARAERSAYVPADNPPAQHVGPTRHNGERGPQVGGVLLSAIWYTVRFFSMLGTGGGGGCCSYSVGKGFA